MDIGDAIPQAAHAVTVFDFEPEDAYDASDPPDVIARNLVRRLQHLAVDLAAKRGRANDRDRLRAAQLAADLDTLRRRL